MTQLLGHLEYFRDEDEDCIPRLFILSDLWILKRSDLFLCGIRVKRDFMKINAIILLSDPMCTNCVVMLYFWSYFVVG